MTAPHPARPTKRRAGEPRRGGAGARGRTRRPDSLYLARFTAPEFTSPLPGHRPAGLRAPGDRLRARRLADRVQVAEALPRLVPQPRRFPRGLHARDRQADRGGRQARAGCASAATGIRAAASRSTSSGRPARRPRVCGCRTRAWRLTAGVARATSARVRSATTGRTRSSGVSAGAPRWTKPATRSSPAQAQHRRRPRVVGVPVGDPVRAIAHGLGGDQQRHADRAGGEPLLPLGDRRLQADGRSRDRQRRGFASCRAPPSPSPDWAGRRRAARAPLTYAALASPSQHNEPPRQELAVIGHARRQPQQLRELVFVRPGRAQGRRRGRAAARQEAQNVCVVRPRSAAARRIRARAEASGSSAIPLKLAEARLIWAIRSRNVESDPAISVGD